MITMRAIGRVLILGAALVLVLCTCVACGDSFSCPEGQHSHSEFLYFQPVPTGKSVILVPQYRYYCA